MLTLIQYLITGGYYRGLILVRSGNNRFLYMSQRDYWVCHRDVHQNRRNPVQHLPSKPGPAKTGNVTLKMPGIILLIIPFPIPRIKPLKSLFSLPSIRPIPIPMVMNYLPIQTHQGLSNPQKRWPRMDPNPDFKIFPRSVLLLLHFDYNNGIFRILVLSFFYLRYGKMA